MSIILSEELVRRREDKRTDAELDALIEANRALYEEHLDWLARKTLGELVCEWFCAVGLVGVIGAIVFGAI